MEARQGEKAGKRAQLTKRMTEVSGPGGENRKTGRVSSGMQEVEERGISKSLNVAVVPSLEC